MTPPSSPKRRWFGAWTRAWLLLLVFCLLGVGVVEIALLELAHGGGPRIDAPRVLGLHLAATSGSAS